VTESQNVFDGVCPPEDDTGGGLGGATGGGPGDDIGGGPSAAEESAELGDDPMIAALTFATFDQLAELTGLDASGLDASFLHGTYSVSPDAVAAALAADFGPHHGADGTDGHGVTTNGEDATRGGAASGGGRYGCERAAAASLGCSEGEEMEALLDCRPSPHLTSNGRGALGGGCAGAGRGKAAAATLGTFEAEMLDYTPSPHLASEDLSGASSSPVANDTRGGAIALSDNTGGGAIALSDMPELSLSRGTGLEAPASPAHTSNGADLLRTDTVHTASVHTDTVPNGDCEDVCSSGDAASSAGNGGRSAKRPLACEDASRTVLARTAA
jgi:hypothetical protein